MKMLRKILPPRVQHRRDADRATEMPRVSTEGEQRVGGGAEEERVDHARIALREGVERVRQGEDDVKILDLCSQEHKSSYVLFPVMWRSVRNAFFLLQTTPVQRHITKSFKLDGSCLTQEVRDV